MNKNCALVLAAGFSKRFGQDKRLSSQPPLIVQTLENVQAVFKTIFLVHRADDLEFLKVIQGFDVNCISAPKDEISLGTSISTALLKIDALECFDTCSIFLADMPYISKKSIEKLLEVSAADKITRPQHKSTLGHPVIFGNKFFSDLKELRGKDGANSVVKKNFYALQIIQVHDKGTIFDIDFMQDIYKEIS